MEKETALKILRDLHNNVLFSERTALETLIPELKESEDEDKIMKELIYNIIVSNDNTPSSKEIFSVYGKTKEDAIAWIEKQGEQKETLCDKCRKTQPSHSCQDITSLGRCAVEHDQKPADKVEPKFHEGDWISGYYTNYKVLSVNNNGYVVEDVDGSKINILFENEKFHHLFTITDAKAGDVLVSDYEGGICITILKSVVSCNEIEMYCHSVNSELFIAQSGFSNATWHPATKEQRDLFFQKMKEEVTSGIVRGKN